MKHKKNVSFLKMYLSLTLCVLYYLRWHFFKESSLFRHQAKCVQNFNIVIYTRFKILWLSIPELNWFSLIVALLRFVINHFLTIICKIQIKTQSLILLYNWFHLLLSVAEWCKESFFLFYFRITEKIFHSIIYFVK